MTNQQNIIETALKQVKKEKEQSRNNRIAKKVGTVTQTPQCSIQIDPKLIETITLDEVYRQVDLILPNKHKLLLLTLAVCVSHFIEKKTPLWIMFVGPPSSAKTEIACLTIASPSVYLLDTLTENAFVSGARLENGQEPMDLLPRLDGKTFLVKDFTTTLSKREETVRAILGDLTSIYDQAFSKHSGARGTIRYSSLFSMIGCVTPQALNRHQRYMNQIGPRFLFYRLQPSTKEQVDEGFAVLWKKRDKDFKELVAEVAMNVSAYLCQLIEKTETFQLSDENNEIKTFLNNLARFVAKARGTVLTRQAEFINSEDEKVTFYEPVEIQVEEPFRALLQLRVLLRSLNVASNSPASTDITISLVREVAMSSMPADRSLLLSIIAKENRTWTAKEVADALKISHRTALRQMDELVSLDILSKTGQGEGMANEYEVMPEVKDVVYTSVEFMSRLVGSKTQTPQDSVDDLSKTPPKNDSNVSNDDEMPEEDTEIPF